MSSSSSVFFFFNDTATTEIYTLSLHDALPISSPRSVPQAAPHAVEVARRQARGEEVGPRAAVRDAQMGQDRKSTRLNSSHANISYAVFCLKKKNRAATLTCRRRSKQYTPDLPP